MIRAALYALIWWEAVGAGDGEAPDSCRSFKTLDERSTFWMDWLLAAADDLRQERESTTGADENPINHAVTIRQALGLGTKRQNRPKAVGVVWPWLVDAQERGAPSTLLTRAANNRMGVYMRGCTDVRWGRRKEMGRESKQAVRWAVDALAQGDEARQAWAELSNLHRETVKRLWELIPDDRLPSVLQLEETEARPEPRRDDNMSSVSVESEAMGSDKDVWSGLPHPDLFRRILAGCLDGEQRLYASDSFAVLLGVWQLCGPTLSGIFPAIHQRRDGRESLFSHLQYLATDSRNHGTLGRGNPWVIRHVAQLACLVLESGGNLIERADWDAAFRAHRQQMDRNYPGGPGWAQRRPENAAGQNPARPAVRDLAQQGVRYWESNGPNSRAWVQAWLDAKP